MSERGGRWGRRLIWTSAVIAPCKSHYEIRKYQKSTSKALAKVLQHLMVKQRREGLPLLPSASLIQSRQHLGSMQEWGPESPSYHSGFRISYEGQALLPMPKAVLIPTVTHHHVLKILPLIHPAGPVGATFAGAWRGGKGFGQGTRCWRCRPDLLGPVPAVEIPTFAHLPPAAQCPSPGSRPFLLLCSSQGELSSASEHAALTMMSTCSSIPQQVAALALYTTAL